MSDTTTDFGFTKVPRADKSKLVEQVFSNVASRYDLMNDLMSFGLHRIWKKIALHHCQPRPGQCILDCAGGTGDLTRSLAQAVGVTGQVILADINAAMLREGRDKLANAGLFKPITILQADCQTLPLPANACDSITLAFGLRNVTDKDCALAELYRVLKPGGKLIILEFSKPLVACLAKVYDLYSFNIIPKLGQLLLNDAASYQYLVESIRRHPDQATLQQQVLNAGFDTCEVINLSGGICAIHKGIKY